MRGSPAAGATVGAAGYVVASPHSPTEVTHNTPGLARVPVLIAVAEGDILD